MARYIWRAAFAQRFGIASIQLTSPQVDLATRASGTDTVLTQLKYTLAFLFFPRQRDDDGLGHGHCTDPAEIHIGFNWRFYFFLVSVTTTASGTEPVLTQLKYTLAFLFFLPFYFFLVS